VVVPASQISSELLRIFLCPSEKPLRIKRPESLTDIMSECRASRYDKNVVVAILEASRAGTPQPQPSARAMMALLTYIQGVADHHQGNGEQLTIGKERNSVREGGRNENSVDKEKEAVKEDGEKKQEKEKEKGIEMEKGKDKEKEGEDGVAVEETVRWVFVCASVGDCKALHFSKKRREITDITYGNRLDVRSATDPGGRLGAMEGDGAPDLRNLSVHFCPCDDDDLLILLSDGVHDNFDPVTRGLNPSDIGLPDEEWETVEDAQLMEKKSLYLKHEAEVIVNGLPICPITGVPSAQSVAHAFAEAARTTCTNSRNYMEKTGEQQPDDLKIYPGKMDHATCLCLNVGYHLLFSH